MIVYTVLLLLIIGAFSSTRTGVKADRVLAVASVASLFVVFINFCESMFSGTMNAFSFEWNASQGRNVAFDIVSNPYNYSLIFSCFVVTILACFHNLLFRYEERRAAYNAVLCFNLVAQILLITSNNFVQLVSGLFITDILALFLMKDGGACRLFSMMNMLADMMLFMVLAVVNSRVDSLDLAQVSIYREIGIHANWIALIGLTAIFIKLGFFGVHLGILELKNIRFHRMQNVLFLSSPFAALILLVKFRALWSVSEYFTLYLDIMCVLTAIWAFCCSIWVNDFKSKTIYWMMAFWALMVELLRFSEFVWVPEFNKLILEMYVFMTAMYLFYFYNNRRKLTTQMMQLRLVHKERIASVLLNVMLVIMAAALTLSTIYYRVNGFYIWGFSVLFLLSVAMAIGQICFHYNSHYVGVQHDISFKWIVFFELLGICVWLLKGVQLENFAVWGSIIVFSLAILLLPAQKLSEFYKVKSLQQNNLGHRLYHGVVRSLRLSGYLLGLLIDRIFLERVVLSSMVVLSTTTVRLFRRLHNSPLAGGVAVLSILGTMLWYSFKHAWTD